MPEEGPNEGQVDELAAFKAARPEKLRQEKDELFEKLNRVTTLFRDYVIDGDMDTAHEIATSLDAAPPVKRTTPSEIPGEEHEIFILADESQKRAGIAAELFLLDCDEFGDELPEGDLKSTENEIKNGWRYNGMIVIVTTYKNPPSGKYISLFRDPEQNTEDTPQVDTDKDPEDELARKAASRDINKLKIIRSLSFFAYQQGNEVLVNKIELTNPHQPPIPFPQREE